MTNDYYGFTSTDEVKFDAQGLPLGEHKVMIIGEEPDSKERGIVAEFEIVEGEQKGKRAKVWYLTKHEKALTKKIAIENVKRIADATGRAVSGTSPLKGRVLRVLVGVQKNDADRTEIKKYLPADKVDVPF